MRGPESRYRYEPSAEEQQFVERSIIGSHDTRPAWLPGVGFTAFLIAVSIAFLGSILHSDSIRNLGGALLFSGGTFTLVLTARTRGARLLTSVLLIPLVAAWWFALGLFPGDGLADAGFIPCVVIPLSGVTIMLTLAGMLRLRRESLNG